MQVTPEWIDDLKDNEVFVFGSNEAGRHLFQKSILSLYGHYFKKRDKRKIWL